MREKMIEILRGVIKFHEEQKEKWILDGKIGERPSIIESFVDILIANDTVPVVRCKDCVHCENEICKNPFGLLLTSRDSFCSYGERRTDA